MLRANFTDDRGIIQPKKANYLDMITDREWDAIDYLLNEWDYGFSRFPLAGEDK